mmetsp:Transcript_175070/g.555999  ORF Transcript_175070/g.555999 Transcript_175070/m.555999 type:complete len:119 (-) Transcript_175070:393-749(-)
MASAAYKALESHLASSMDFSLSRFREDASICRPSAHPLLSLLGCCRQRSLLRGTMVSPAGFACPDAATTSGTTTRVASCRRWPEVKQTLCELCEGLMACTDGFSSSLVRPGSRCRSCE